MDSHFNPQLDYSNERTIRNWVVELNLYCKSGIYTSLFGALFFFGVLFSMLILAYTSKFGRKVNLNVTNFITLLDLIIIVFVQSSIVRYIGMFILGI